MPISIIERSCCIAIMYVAMSFSTSLFVTDNANAAENEVDPEACHVYFWPVQSFQAGSAWNISVTANSVWVSPRVEYANVVQALNSRLSPDAQFAIFRTLGVERMIPARPFEYHMGQGNPNGLELRRRGPPIAPQDNACLVEVIPGGARLEIHAIYGVTMNLAYLVRIYRGNPEPFYGVRTGGGSKLRDALDEI